MSEKPTYEDLEQRVRELEKADFERKQAEAILQERIKELKCLYGISTLLELPGISLDEMFKKTVMLIPPAWQFPEITAACIVLNGQSFQTENFRETPWMQTRKIIVHGKPVGQVEVCYLEEQPASDEGPFTTEERHLLNAIAERLGKILERMRAKEALRESEEKYHSLVDSTDDWVWACDTEGRQTFANEAVKTILSYDVHEIEGVLYENLIHPEDQRKTRQWFKSLIEKKEGWKNSVICCRHKDGTLKFLESTAQPSFDSKGNLTGFIGIDRDITDRKRAEEALRESEERFRTAFEDASTGIALMAKEGYFLEVNQTLCRILGYSEEELMGKTWVEITEPDDLDGCFNWLKRVKAGEQSAYEKRFIHKLGYPLWVMVSSSVIRDSQDQIRYYISLFHDISKLKKVEETLLVSERDLGIKNRIAEIFLTTPNEEMYGEVLQVVLETMQSPYGTFAYINEDGDRVVPSMTRDIWDECKIPDKDIIFPREKWHDTLWAKCLIEKKSVSSDGPFKVPEGHIPIIRAMAVPIIYQGQAIGNFMVGNKPTKYSLEDKELLETIANQIASILHARLMNERYEGNRKQAEETLSYEKERLFVTLRSIGDGVITSDLSGRVVLINKEAETLTGWSEEKARGMPMTEVFNIINQHTRKECESPVDIILKTGTVVGLANHTILIARDGTERIVADSGAPIRDVNGNIVGIVLVFRDITDRVRMEEELLRNQKLESLGVLAGGIAHDLNNILTTIIGNVSMAKDQVRPEDEIFDLLKESEMASTRAQTLTKQLLTFAKGGAPVKETASIKAILKESSSFVLRGSKSLCEFSIAEDLWSAEVDVGQISQVINNIVINANQAMPEGGIIQVAAENLIIEDNHGLPGKPGRYISISITDQGVGIAQKHLLNIFDPYFTTKQEGSGLGLATSYSIIKKHDGHITVESQLGVGTTFHIYLPASDKIVPEKEKVKLIKGQGRILVMDDEASLRKVVGRMLKNLGYESEFAKDGAEAIWMYKEAQETEEPYDAVILDLTIPGGMGGKDAVKKLLEIDPEVKAIVSSGYSADLVLANFQEYGFKGMMPKPFTSQSLGKVLHEVLQGEKE